MNDSYSFEDLSSRKIFEAIAGSKAYGLDDDNSDTDLRSVIIPENKFFYGFESFEQYNCKNNDYIFYSLKRFLELNVKNNVNTLELLWVPEDKINYIHPIFQKVLDNKELFSSKKFYNACRGYIVQQMQIAALTKHSNPNKQMLIEKFGYNTKPAMHVFRLLDMGIEFLNTGKLNVLRPNRQELLNIKEGKYSLQELWTLGIDGVNSGMAFEKLKELEQAYQNCVLPDEVNRETIEKLLISIQKEYLHHANC